MLPLPYNNVLGRAVVRWSACMCACVCVCGVVDSFAPCALQRHPTHALRVNHVNLGLTMR